MARLRLFLLLFAFLVLPLTVHAQAAGGSEDEVAAEDGGDGEDAESDALFQQVFGKRATPEAADIEVPLVIDEVDRSLITITVADDPAAISIDARTLMAELRSFLLPEPQARLAGLIKDGKLTGKDLAALRIKTNFDQSDLVLRLDLPADIRKPLDLPFSSRGQPPPAENPVGPANYSAYLNMRSGIDNVHETDNADGEGKQPLRMDFNGAFALPRLAFDYRLSFTERAERPLQRGDMRFLFDQPEHLRRFAFGDVDYPVSRFQGFVPLGGVSVARNYSLNPYVVTEPQGRSEFVLLSPSRVEILVNGARVRTLRLPAGRYNIRDLPISAGANDVILRITNDVGEVQEINYSLFFDSELLAPGLDRYSFTMGFPQDVEDGLYKYNTSKASFSSNYRVGLTDTFTAGGSLQGDNDQQIIGADALWATGIGTFDSSVAVSYLEGYNADFASRLVYGMRDVGEGRYESFDLAAQYTGLYYAPLGRTNPDNDTSWDLAARYGRRLPYNLNGSLGGTYRFGRNEALDTHSVGLSLSRPLMPGANVSFDLERRKTTDGEMESRGFVSFNWSLYDSGHSFNATRDTISRSSRLDWSYRPTPFLGNFAANGGVQRNGNSNDFFGDVSRTDYRSEFSLSHDINLPRRATDETERVSSLRMGSALVFADGHFGISRPVTDSFALVVPNKALEGQAVGVNPRGDNKEYQSENSKIFGNAVVPDLTSYQQRRVLVDAPDLPIGTDLGKDVFDVTPTVRAGAIIRIGTEATVLLTATVVDAANAPLELAAGEIAREGDASSAPILVFTNRDGVLSSEGLRPGRHLLTMFDFPDAPISFEIPAGTTGSYDAGTLRAGLKSGDAPRPAPTGVPPARPDDLAPARRADATPVPATPAAPVPPAEAPAPPAVPIPPVAAAPVPAPPATIPQAPPQVAAVAPPAAGAAAPAAPRPPEASAPDQRPAAPVSVEAVGSGGNLGVWRIQLAAFRDAEQVADAWKLLQARHADLLTPYRAFAVEVEIPDRGTFYRLQVGPLRDANLARRLCAEFSNRRQSCLVVSPVGRGPAVQSERALPSLAQGDIPLPALPARPAPAVPAAGPAEPVAPPAVPAPAPPAPLQPASIEAPLGGGVLVQLSAARSAAAAEAEWARLQRRHSDLLGDLEGFVIEVDLGAGKGVVHRLQLGPLPDRPAAERLCVALKERGQDCLVGPSGLRAATPTTPAVTVPPRADSGATTSYAANR